MPIHNFQPSQESVLVQTSGLAFILELSDFVLHYGVGLDRAGRDGPKKKPACLPILWAPGYLRPTTRWSAVRGGLDAVQLRVLTALGHQLIVRADLHESGPIEHDDEIGHADGRETVGDEDRDAAAVALAGAACRCGIALEQRVLSFRVQRGGRLVEDQQQRLIAHEAARQRELLPLAER